MCEKVHYCELLKQKENLDAQLAKSEAFLSMHCPNGEWKQLAKAMLN